MLKVGTPLVRGKTFFRPKRIRSEIYEISVLSPHLVVATC